VAASSVHVLITVVALFLFSIIFELRDTLAISPTFSIEHIPDSVNDQFVDPLTPYSDCESTTYPSLSDIAHVDYVSDGNTLNATVWLSPSEFDEQHQLRQLSQLFSLGLNVISEYEPDVTNALKNVHSLDYIFAVKWVPLNQSWIGSVYQTNPQNYIDNKILAHIENQSGFFEINQHYFHLSLPLKYLNYPERYNANIVLEDMSDQYCRVADITNWALFPAPKFNTTVSPTSLILRPEEQGTVELKVKSDASRDSIVNLDAQNVPNLMTTFTPQNFSLPSFSESASRLTVKAPPQDHVRPGSYQLSINQTISFAPTIVDVTEYSAQVERTRPTSLSTNRIIPITVTLLPPLTTEERLSNFVDAWITPIGALWTFLVGAAAVISPLLLRVYKQRKKKGGAEYSINT
jgi:hypothetical protein